MTNYVAKNIKYLRTYYNMSQLDVAEHVGASINPSPQPPKRKRSTKRPNTPLSAVLPTNLLLP